MAQNDLLQPTEIQVAAFQAVQEGGDVLLASHTGSGKTLAYLLPVVSAMKAAERETGRATRPGRPRVLVLGPTRELAMQLLRVSKSLSHHEKFRADIACGGSGWELQTKALSQPLDVLVGTPNRVLGHAAKGHLAFGDVRWLVLDEADTMFDAGFGEEVKQVVKAVRGGKTPADTVLVAATVTKAISKLLAEEFPNMRRVETRSLHRAVTGSSHTFLPVSPQSDKLASLLQTVSRISRGDRIMVFCNTLASCRATEHHLAEAGLPTLTYHGDIPLGGRKEAIEEFEGEAEKQPILVCTDLAARGLDIKGRVDHVINFDFPLNPVDYLHRTGRTARAGAPGNVVSFVDRRDQVLAGRIEEALKRDLPLDGLSGDKQDLPAHMRPKPETLKRRKEERLAERSSSGRGRRGSARQPLPKWAQKGTASSSSRNASKGKPRTSRPSGGGAKGGGSFSKGAGGSEKGAGGFTGTPGAFGKRRGKGGASGGRKRAGLSRTPKQ